MTSKSLLNGWQGLLYILCLTLSLPLAAEERTSDPDGCLSCHVLPGLEFVDKDGVLRVATIIKEHYYSSLHGSIPCKDCHRKITDYPHKVENGYVDCSSSCHLNEPSNGERFSHKPIVEEFEKSAHGEAWTKEFAGGNRLEEESEILYPSCRRCHRNTLYIPEEQNKLFMESFAHIDTECGACHEGDVWRNQFGGHILRRLIGSRWKKNGSNQYCIDCHADHSKMEKVEVEDFETKEKSKVDFRWVRAVDSYQRSLHSRLLVTGVEEGASCMDCHAPSKHSAFRHLILADEDPKSSTHPDILNETCGQSSCHEFSKNKLNSGFVNTDQHDLDLVGYPQWMSFFDFDRLESYWQRSLYVIIPLLVGFFLGGVYWVFFQRKNKAQDPIIGNDHFERVIIGRKKRKTKPRAKPVKKVQAKEPDEIPSDIEASDDKE
ncbi:MAG: multiheme c-type cytochrome [Methylococcaceae bacterium]